MLRVFLEVAFVTVAIAWVLAKVLSALGRWSDEHSTSKQTDPEIHSDELDFGTLRLVFVMVLLFLLLVPSAVTSNGQPLSLHEVSVSMRASKDVATLATFVGAWRADDPLAFWGFFAGLFVTVLALFRRSPALLGAAMIASLFALWLKMNL